MRHACAAALIFLASLCTFDTANAQKMTIGENTLAPMAFTQFCLRHPADCVHRVGSHTASLEALNAINRLVNLSIVPKYNTGGLAAESWDLYPPAGDCNDYAITKRHELLRRGFPTSAVLLALSRVPGGEMHVVVIVLTNLGDFVLDNLRDGVVRYDRLRYRWHTRMSVEDPKFWRRIISQLRSNPELTFWPTTCLISPRLRGTPWPNKPWHVLSPAGSGLSRALRRAPQGQALRVLPQP